MLDKLLHEMRDQAGLLGEARKKSNPRRALDQWNDFLTKIALSDDFPRDTRKHLNPAQQATVNQFHMALRQAHAALGNWVHQVSTGSWEESREEAGVEPAQESRFYTNPNADSFSAFVENLNVIKGLVKYGLMALEDVSQDKLSGDSGAKKELAQFASEVKTIRGELDKLMAKTERWSNRLR